MTLSHLEQLELDLIRLSSSPSPSTSTSASTSPANPSPPSIDISVEHIISANFKDVLLSEPGKRVCSNSARYGLGGLFSAAGIEEAGSIGDSATRDGNEDDAEGILFELIVGIACLHAFIQINWTGPDLSFSPKDLFPTASTSSNTASASPSNVADADIDYKLHQATIPLLSLDGEPAYHLSKYPTFLLLAIRIFESLSTRSKSLPTDKQLKTLPWWLLRASTVHRLILDDPVPYPSSLFSDLNTLLNPSPMPNRFLSLDDLASLHIELGLANHLLQQDRLAGEEFLLGAKDSGLEWTLTGALGRKTRYQRNETSQLVLMARSRVREGEEVEAGEEDGEQVAEAGQTVEPGQGNGNGAGNGNENGWQELTDENRAENVKIPGLPETLALNDDTLLEQTQFTTSTAPSTSTNTLPPPLASLNPNSQPALYPLDQALLIDFCLAQHNNTPENGLTASQMMPFLNRVISHPRNWSIHTTALLLRARLESQRSRTVERSVLQLQALVDQMPTADSEPRERLTYFHQLPLPSKWSMEKELALRFLGMGVVRTALEIFERLEMWEEAVRCYVNMEETSKAVKIVEDLLEGRKEETESVTARRKADDTVEEGKRVVRRNRIDKAREGKLWCLLGDLVADKAEEYYTRAWEVSGHSSSRAQRSLGGLNFAKEAFEAAVENFRAALKINPLYSRTWFTLGCALVRLERWEEAREAFSRTIAVEEEDAEAWNNLAAVYLRMTREIGAKKAEDGEEQAVPFTNKQLAFKALQQGLKHSRDSSKMWQNFMIVAVDVGQMAEAARGLARVIESTNGKNGLKDVDYAVLSKLVDAVTREDWNSGKGNRAPDQPLTSNEGLGLLPIVERLFNEVILPRIPETPRVYTIQARLFRWKEDWSAALDCYMKAYRCGIAQDVTVEQDVTRFRETLQDVEELVDVMRALGPKAKEQEAAAGLEKGKAKWNDWKFQARTLVRTFQGRTRESFEDDEAFDKLKELLGELRA